MRNLSNFINGQHQPSNSGRSQPVYNPATGEAPKPGEAIASAWKQPAPQATSEGAA